MEKYMQLAIKEATKAFKKGEVPVGVVIVENGVILSKTHNKRRNHNDVTSHAEILAIKKITKKRKDWRLDNCEMYVTLEPCSMCKEVIKESRIKKVYYALEGIKHNKKTVFIKTDAYEKESAKLLKTFFETKRK